MSYNEILEDLKILKPFLQKHGLILIGEIIGKGGYGEISLVKNSNRKIYAIKKTILTDSNKDITFNELKALKKISSYQNSSDYIARYIDDFVYQNSILYILEDYIQGPNLQEYINIVQKWNIKSKWTLLINLAEMLDYIHSKNVAHKDIKPENIIYQKNKQTFKLVDFGLSCIKDMECFDYQGTFEYMYLESFSEDVKRLEVSKAADIWAMGVVFHQIIFGVNLHPNIQLNIRNVFKEINNYKIMISESEKTNYILRKMLQPNWENRINSEELISFLVKNYDEI